MQLVYRVAFDATVHVVPLTHLGRTFNIIVGHVHTAGVCHASVDDYYLAMVARPYVIDERKADRVELIYLYSLCTDGVNILLSHRTVVRHVAESIVQQPHLYALLHLGGEMGYKQTVDGIVAKVEVFHVNGTAGLVYGLEKVVEFLLSRHQQGYRVVAGEADALALKRAYNQRVACLCMAWKGDDDHRGHHESRKKLSCRTIKLSHSFVDTCLRVRRVILSVPAASAVCSTGSALTMHSCRRCRAAVSACCRPVPSVSCKGASRAVFR